MLLGYAYCIPALWAIPSAPLETEYHLRHAIVRMEDIRLVRNVLLTDRHSLILQSAASNARAILSNACAIRSITSGSFIQSPLASFFPSRIISSHRCHSININSKALERLFAACRRAYLSIIAHVPMGMRAQMLVNAP